MLKNIIACKTELPGLKQEPVLWWSCILYASHLLLHHPMQFCLMPIALIALCYLSKLRFEWTRADPRVIAR